jgi:hypothetical protein
MSGRELVHVMPARRIASHYNARLRRFILADHYLDCFTFHACPAATSFTNSAAGNVLKTERSASTPRG